MKALSTESDMEVMVFCEDSQGHSLGTTKERIRVHQRKSGVSSVRVLEVLHSVDRLQLGCEAGKVIW